MQNYYSVANVARGKTARISNSSKWSTQTDGIDLLSETDRSFAFHTPHDTVPSVEIDLEKVYRLDNLKIFNRKDSHQYRAAPLIVETSIDGEDWMLLHSGTLYWSGALHLPCSGMIAARHVRLRLPDRGAFHLQRIEVNARRYDRFGEPVVVARRTDGLGERLNALINAIWLSDILGTGFRFSWGDQLIDDPHHAIFPIERMFSDRFIRDHHVPTAATDKAWGFANRAETIETLKWKVFNDGPISGPRTSLPDLISQEGPSPNPAGSVKAFQRIGFSDEVQAALDLADAVPLPQEAVGLHLRSGDIFYKHYRKYVHYTYKGLTIPIAKIMIEKAKADGHSVYIFGQDAEQIAYLAKTCGAVDSSTLETAAVAGMERHQKAMYDLKLLSRFSKILGGHSGFARQASWIGGGEVVLPQDMFSVPEQHDASMKDLAANEKIYHPLQTAFAYWHAYYYGRKGRDVATNTGHLRKAIAFDPHNELYFIALASHLESVEAEAVLRNLFEARIATNQTDEIFRVFKSKTNTRYNLSEYIPVIEAGARAGGFFQSALMADFLISQDRRDEAERYLKTCHAVTDGADTVAQRILTRFA